MNNVDECIDAEQIKNKPNIRRLVEKLNYHEIDVMKLSNDQTNKLLEIILVLSR